MNPLLEKANFYVAEFHHEFQTTPNVELHCDLCGLDWPTIDIRVFWNSERVLGTRKTAEPLTIPSSVWLTLTHLEWLNGESHKRLLICSHPSAQAACPHDQGIKLDWIHGSEVSSASKCRERALSVANFEVKCVGEVSLMSSKYVFCGHRRVGYRSQKKFFNVLVGDVPDPTTNCQPSWNFIKAKCLQPVWSSQTMSSHICKCGTQLLHIKVTACIWQELQGRECWDIPFDALQFFKLLSFIFNYLWKSNRKIFTLYSEKDILIGTRTCLHLHRK